MLNKEQDVLFKNNSSSETGDSTPTTGPINVEHAQHTDGLKPPLTPFDVIDSDGHIKYDKSAVDVHTSQTENVAGLDKISVDNGQITSTEEIASPGEASVSANGNQPSKEHVSTGKPADDNQSHHDHVSGLRTKFAFDMNDVMTQIVGDIVNINLGPYVNMVKEFDRKSFDSVFEDPEQSNETASSNELIRDALKFAEQSSTLLPEGESESDSIKLPDTQKEFSLWYYSLGDYEQCFVQTAAVLHGSPVHEISKAADLLYKFLCDELAKRESSVHFMSQLGISNHQGVHQKNKPGGSLRFPDPLLRSIPRLDLHLSTHIKTGRDEDVECLYWRDVDQFGVSKFGLKLLAFLTNEFINRGEYGQNFLDLLYDWSKDNSKGNLSWKVAHSYGVILWCHDAKLLRKRANEWASVKSRFSWQRTAELLDGAFEIESIRCEEGNVPTVVERLLDSWIDRVHQEFTAHTQFIAEQNKNVTKVAKSERDQSKLALATNLAWAVSKTYELIGKRSPEKALSGLQRLLKLPLIESDYSSRSVYAAVVSTYISLARSRLIRDVLKHMDESVVSISLQRPMTGKLEDRLKNRLHRQIYLNAIFHSFFTISVESYLGRKKEPPVFYSLTEPLPSNPVVPDPEGRDVLFAALLSQNEEKFKEHINALLCSAIIEKKSRLAFSLLRFWADIVFEMLRKPAIDRDAVKKYVAFYRFILNLGRTVEIWCLALEKQGICSPQAMDAFKCRLKQWYEEGCARSHPIGSLAEVVLKELDCKFQL